MAYGGNEIGAGIGLRVLRDARENTSATCDIIVFAGRVKEHPGPSPDGWRRELLRAAQNMRRDESTLMAYCAAGGDEFCVTMRQVPESPRYYAEMPDTQKIPRAVSTRSGELLNAAPGGLRSLGLDHHLPTGLTYVKDSASPLLAVVVSGTVTTTLRWLWDGPIDRADFTTTYRVAPAAPVGAWPIGGLLDVVPRSGERHEVLLTPVAVNVTGPCAPTPSATPPPTPTATAPPGPAYLPLTLREQSVPSRKRIDVVLVIDASTSMRDDVTSAGRSKLDAAIEAAELFVATLALPQDQAAVVIFNSDAQVVQGLTGKRADIEAALARIPRLVRQQTRIDRGIEEASRELGSIRRKSVNQAVVILLTDGLANSEPATTAVRRAQEAKDAGITVFTIGLGQTTDLNVAELERMASRPEYFYRARDGEDLAAIYETIAVEIPCPAATYWGRR